MLIVLICILLTLNLGSLFFSDNGARSSTLVFLCLATELLVRVFEVDAKENKKKL